MATTQEYFDRKGLGPMRTGGSYGPVGPQSPHTPQRGISSTLSSPGGGYRVDDESVVLQIGSRSLHAGFAGDSKPRCTVSYGGTNSRRVGDYRPWLPGFRSLPTTECSGENWGRDRELWRMDTRSLDLGLVRDKLERALRDVYTKHLLIDSKSRKVLLALPSLLPHSIINVLLVTLFYSFQVPSVAMLPLPILSVMAAGQRTGMVVDIGWHETTVTSVYEYREMRQTRSVRAMKATTRSIAHLLSNISNGKAPSSAEPDADVVAGSNGEDEGESDFDFAEDVTVRLAWCHCEPAQSRDVAPSPIELDDRSGDVTAAQQNTADVIFNIAVPGDDRPRSFEVLQIGISKVVESTLLLQTTEQIEQDDEELPIPYLLYRSLLAMSPDTRAPCLRNIIFIGGGANIPGLKTRILTDLSRLVYERSWTLVNWPSTRSRARGGLKAREEAHMSRAGNDAQAESDTQLRDHSSLSSQADTGTTSLKECAPSHHDAKTYNEAFTDTRMESIRSVATLGPWTGASIAASMRIRGTVEVERETFVQSGLAGSRNLRDGEHNVVKARQSLGPSLARGTSDGSWTLGNWG